MNAQRALIVVDMQNDFVPNAPPEFSSHLVPSIASVLNKSRASGIPVVHVQTEYADDKSDWPAACRHRDFIWCIAGTQGAEFIEPLRPHSDEVVITKKRFSGFYETPLEETLRDLGITEIAFAGYALDACVRLTAIDAYNRSIPFTILRDCVMAERSQQTEALEYLRWLTNCPIEYHAEWLARHHDG